MTSSRIIPGKPAFFRGKPDLRAVLSSIPRPLHAVGELYAYLGCVKQGVFIERDGILNTVRVEKHHQVSPLVLEDFRLNMEAVPLIKKLKAAGLVVIATTNQPGLSRGYQSRRELDRMHDLLRATFALDDVLLCPHDETDHCPCRKPRPGLLVEAGFKWQLNLEHSFVIGEKWQDAAAARTAGCTSLMLQSQWSGNVHRDFLVPDLATAVEKILLLKSAKRKTTV